MKAAAAALILMAVLFTAAVLHGQYVDRLTCDLTALEASFPVKTAEKLPSDPTIGKAETVWQKADVLLSVTVNARQRIAISTALRSVVWVKYKIKDKEVFEKAYIYIEQYY